MHPDHHPFTCSDWLAIRSSPAAERTGCPGSGLQTDCGSGSGRPGADEDDGCDSREYVRSVEVHAGGHLGPDKTRDRTDATHDCPKHDPLMKIPGQRVCLDGLHACYFTVLSRTRYSTFPFWPLIGLSIHWATASPSASTWAQTSSKVALASAGSSTPCRRRLRSVS